MSRRKQARHSSTCGSSCKSRNSSVMSWSERFCDSRLVSHCYQHLLLFESSQSLSVCAGRHAVTQIFPVLATLILSNTSYWNRSPGSLYAVVSSCLDECMQAEEATGDRLEMSREVASLRLKLTSAAQEADGYRKELGLARASPGLAEQHEAALADLRQEISALQTELAQTKASMWLNGMHGACDKAVAYKSAA